MDEIKSLGSEAARAAWLYYLEDLTQGEIAQEMGVSRSTVTRLLQRAKSDGLVQVSLKVPSGIFQAERDLERAFGLDRARIVPNSGNDAMQKRWLGHVAAEVMVSLVSTRAIVAIGWGSTMQSLADALAGQQPVADAQIVALVGGFHSAVAGTNTNEVARQVGHYFQAPAFPLLAPVYVQDAVTARGLSNEPGIRGALQLAREASMVVFSVGAMHEDTTMMKLGHLTAAQKSFLAERGAVGDIACRWLDRQGDPVEMPPSIHPIGISLEELRTIPTRLTVAGGDSKREIVLACLRGGFATSLVTDERLARFLLQQR